MAPGGAAAPSPPSLRPSPWRAAVGVLWRLVAPPGYIYPVTWVMTPRPPPPLPALRPGAGADKPRQLY